MIRWRDFRRENFFTMKNKTLEITKGVFILLIDLKKFDWDNVNDFDSQFDKWEKSNTAADIETKTKETSGNIGNIEEKAPALEGRTELTNVFDELDETTKKIKGNLLKWGFKTLDENLPMLPGIYLLGALPSMGKTTFALQTAANICEQGEKIIYVSYEPTARQIAFKDLARYWFLKNWGKNAMAEFVPTATNIMLGRYAENSMFTAEKMKEVREELKTKRRNFIFVEGLKETAKSLINKLEYDVKSGAKFIVVDYVQLIKGNSPKKTMREQIDDTVRELQIFQSKNDLIILFISSFNRENYKNYVNLESFKESGSLEYSADAILGLQLEFENEKERGDSAEFQKRKASKPRNVELVCLKNRYGQDFKARFAYHSAHETFIEKIVNEQKSNLSF